MNGKSGTYARIKAFALSPTRQSRYGDGARYRRVNATFYERIKIDAFVKSAAA